MELSQRNSSKPAGSADLLFSMILLLVFILCSVFTILIGSRVYENIRARNNGSFNSDTALGYITNKVRQSDRADCVSLRAQDGCGILVLSSEINETVYETWIYTKDGSLKELFSEKGIGLTVEDGLDIMECAPVTFSEEKTPGGTLLTVTLHTEPDAAETKLLLRSSGEMYRTAGLAAGPATRPAWFTRQTWPATQAAWFTRRPWPAQGPGKAVPVQLSEGGGAL